MMAEGGGRCSVDDYVRKYFGRSKGEEATGIREECKEGGVDGLGYN